MNLLSGASKHFSVSLFKLFLRTCRAVELPMTMDYADQGFLGVDLGSKTVLGFFAFKYQNTSFRHTLM
jgi:hypothetical protein